MPSESMIEMKVDDAQIKRAVEGLEKLGERAYSRYARKAVKYAMIPTLAEIVAAVPYDTGSLARSLEMVQKSKRKTATQIGTVRINPTAEYGGPRGGLVRDYGYVVDAESQYMTKTVQSETPRIVDDYSRKLDEQLTKGIKRFDKKVNKAKGIK